MKSLIILIPVIAVLLYSCSSSQTTGTAYDDVYYSSKQNNTPSKEATRVASGTETYTSKEVYNNAQYDSRFSDGQAKSEAYSSDEFEMEDYYDYEYSSRIKRFHEDNPGMSYYDEYYTDNYYYTDDPSTYGTDIYGGYGNPTSNLSVSVGFGLGVGMGIGYGWGWPSYGYGWPYYGYGYGYSCGWPYYGYGYGYGCGWPYYGYGWGGYWNGYWNGYWDGYYGYGYGTPYAYYGNSYYGGQRGSRGLNTNGTGGGGIMPKNYNDKEQEPIAYAQGRTAGGSSGTTNPVVKTGSNSKSVYPKKPTNNNTAVKTGKDPGNSIASLYPKVKTNTGTPKTQGSAGKQASNVNAKLSKPGAAEARNTKSRQYTPQEKPKYTSPQKYAKPEKRYSKPKTYQAPDYRTARSGQENAKANTMPQRTNTRIQPNANTQGQNTRTQSGKVYSRPTQGNTNKQAPSRTNSRTYSVPSNSNSKGISTPSRTNTRSLSSPAKSTPRSYSSPSRSPSRSISSPSRSTGRSGGSMSGGSRGGSSGSGSSGGGSRGGGGRR